MAMPKLLKPENNIVLPKPSNSEVEEDQRQFHEHFYMKLLEFDCCK